MKCTANWKESHKCNYLLNGKCNFFYAYTNKLIDYSQPLRMCKATKEFIYNQTGEEVFKPT